MSVPEIFQTGDETLDDEAEEKCSETPIVYVNVKQCVNGSWNAIPRRFTIDEIPDVVRLHAELGAGSYELFGRDERNARIVLRRKVVIAPIPGEKAASAASAAPAQAVPQVAAGGSFEHQLLMFMMQAMQETARVQLQTQQQSSQQFQQMMMALLTMSNNNASAHIQSMQGLYQAFGQGQSELVAKMMTQAAGQSPQEIFLKAVEMVNELRAGAAEANHPGGDTEGVNETLDMIGKGLGLFNQVQSLGGGAASAAVAAATGTESAA